MAPLEDNTSEEERQLLTTADHLLDPVDHIGRPSTSSASTASLILEYASGQGSADGKETLFPEGAYADSPEIDMENRITCQRAGQPADRKARKLLYLLVAVGLLGWIAALFLFMGQERQLYHAARPHSPNATSSIGDGKKVQLEQVLQGRWSPRQHTIKWIAGPGGEDGLLLVYDGEVDGDYLVVQDIRYRGEDLSVQRQHSITLMKQRKFQVGTEFVHVDQAWPSKDFKHVLVQSDSQSQFRHSETGRYWIFNVDTQTGEPLDPGNIYGRVQLASWSPRSDTVVFTRDNNMYIRHVDSTVVRTITTDGGKDLFYGIPDWVYEEEVLASGGATWWSGDGKYIAFFRTNESNVPVFPVQYFFSRPSGKKPSPGLESYPEVRNIKYPKAGAPMSVVNLQFYDVDKHESFMVTIDDDFPDNDRLITEVVWAGETGKVIIRSTNRESDILKIISVDVAKRTGKTVRERDVQKLDGGWFEVSQSTKFVPADPSNGRAFDGYIDTVIHDSFDHLAYFTPIENPVPIFLTSGEWEVVAAPSGIDLAENTVYFIGTKDGSTQRHLYSTKLLEGPKTVQAVTDTSQLGYYDVSLSVQSKFMLLTYQGPEIPWQEIWATPTNKQSKLQVSIEKNPELKALAEETELPTEIYQTINVDGFELNLVEIRPPHFDSSGKTKYPILFFLYNGPGFQNVDRKFNVDFQSYVASSLGYIVITLDGRGTGYLGRKHRTIVRGNIGYWEAHDQIAAAKMWAAKNYVDAERIAMWGWSYGGFMTLKTLETDAGQTFKYGMAVAPVTDWRFYDSIYTERYMHTPQHNPGGYANSTISDVKSLAKNVRFLVMHGMSDDNVHIQNTLQLLDRLDQANVRNYDVHVFPDSDHGIFFHNARTVVYEKLSEWLVNAFNGVWLRIDKPIPN